MRCYEVIWDKKRSSAPPPQYDLKVGSSRGFFGTLKLAKAAARKAIEDVVPLDLADGTFGIARVSIRRYILPDDKTSRIEVMNALNTGGVLMWPAEEIGHYVAQRCALCPECVSILDRSWLHAPGGEDYEPNCRWLKMLWMRS